ncbi:hypothetical protein IQ251_08060 [Saccharopolyspora sp. HNM0983]|uniref:PPE family protein n=1 Tax=Saccharopolyspora montiporae TaxID=2781240 RepID=A0A929BB23_9PSEU|nr:hypothetical protein [Saccharopolyspora sp. HNM0983]MBE9374403.1 hypothetical protein [Saccharopolyspora sp. HNM0983]
MAESEFEAARDLRFDGFGLAQLAQFAERLRSGRGAQAVQQAHADLAEADRIVAELEDVLRTSTDRLSAAWQGEAAEQARDSARQHAAGLQESRQALTAAADGLSGLQHDYEAVRNALPGAGDPAAPATDLSEWPRSPFGYEHDQHAGAERADEQQRATRAALENYRDAALGRFAEHDPAGTAVQNADAAAEPGTAEPDAGTAVGVGGGGAALAGSAAMAMPPMMGAGGAGAGGRPRGSAPSAADGFAATEPHPVDRVPGGVLEPPAPEAEVPDDASAADASADVPVTPFDDGRAAAPPVIGAGTIDPDDQEWEPR